MDEIINILVFIVTIAIFIFSAIRKSNNKQPVKNNSGGNLNLESIFGIQTEPLSDLIVEEPEIIVEQKNEEKILKKEKNYIQKGLDVIPNKVKEQQIGKQICEEPEFDLKSAIVYTEILNRKNF